MTTDDDNRPERQRVTLTGISSRAWEHPADRGALTALRELRGFDDVVKAFFGMWNDRGFRLSYLADHQRADDRLQIGGIVYIIFVSRFKCRKVTEKSWNSEIHERPQVA